MEPGNRNSKRSRSESISIEDIEKVVKGAVSSTIKSLESKSVNSRPGLGSSTSTRSVENDDSEDDFVPPKKTTKRYVLILLYCLDLIVS